MKQLHFLLFL